MADMGIAVKLVGRDRTIDKLRELNKSLRDFRPLWPRVQHLAAKDLLRNIADPSLPKLNKRWIQRKGHGRLFELDLVMKRTIANPRIKKTKRRFLAAFAEFENNRLGEFLSDRNNYPYILHHGKPAKGLPPRPWFFWQSPTQEEIEDQGVKFVDERIAQFLGGA